SGNRPRGPPGRGSGWGLVDPIGPLRARAVAYDRTGRPRGLGMARRITRRGALAALAAAGSVVLAACSGRRDDRLASEEHEVDAPSGDFTAIVAADGDVLRPTIHDAAGAAVWTDDLP